MVENKPDAVESALTKITPLVSNVSFGGLMGYCSGYAMKKAGKALAIVCGVAFISLQGAVYGGYINVDWAKIKASAVTKVDTDADGKITTEDAKYYWRKFKEIMVTRLPGGAGFAGGFFFGVKHG